VNLHFSTVGEECLRKLGIMGFILFVVGEH
jgi:hypothetical protein